MNKSQWYVLGIGLFILGSILRFVSPICLMSDADLLSACFIWRYSLTIPGLLFITLGIIFVIFGFLEPKRKHEIIKERESKILEEIARYMHKKGGIDKMSESKKDLKENTKFLEYLMKKYPEGKSLFIEK